MTATTHVPSRAPFLLTLWRDSNAIQKVAALIGLSLVLMALLAPLIAPFDPLAQSLISFRVFIIQTKFGQNLPITGNMMDRVAFGNSLFGETI